MWYVAWIRHQKTTARRWGVMETRKPTKRKHPTIEGAFIATEYWEKFRTRAEAQRRCDQLKAEWTDPRYEFMPLSQWKFNKARVDCSVRPWPSR